MLEKVQNLKHRNLLGNYDLKRTINYHVWTLPVSNLKFECIKIKQLLIEKSKSNQIRTIGFIPLLTESHIVIVSSLNSLQN